MWRDALGRDVRLANDMTPGSLTADDYSVWRNNLGATLLVGAGGSVAVPEATFFVFVAGTPWALAVA